MQLNKKRDNSPIYVQINNDELTNSNLSPALNERSPTLKYTRAALLKLKESIDYKSNESMNYRNNQFNIEKSIDAQEMKGSHLSRQKKNTINLSKLSMVLKNRGAIGASQKLQDQLNGPNKSPFPTGFQQLQKEDFNSLASILNATLSKLKKPNKHFLTPLDQSVIKASHVDSAITKLPSRMRTNSNM